MRRAEAEPLTDGFRESTVFRRAGGGRQLRLVGLPARRDGPLKSAHPYTAALAGALVTGTTLQAWYLISLPFVLHKFSLLETLQWPASNVIGVAAFAQGAPAAIAGVVIHYLIALVWAAAYVYLFAQRRVADLHPALNGAIFGAVVWFVMTFVVQPLAIGPRIEVGALSILSGIFADVVCFGIPLALVVRRLE